MNFQEILREKMKTPTPPPSSDICYSTGLDPAHLAYLMGQTSRFSTISPRGKYATPAAKPARKPHSLNDLQREALLFLAKFSPSLDETFSAPELKKAFRIGALRLHPDQGGSIEGYSKLREYYQRLSVVFAK